MNSFPAKVSNRAMLPNPWGQKANITLFPRMLDRRISSYFVVLYNESLNRPVFGNRTISSPSDQDVFRKLSLGKCHLRTSIVVCSEDDCEPERSQESCHQHRTSRIWTHGSCRNREEKSLPHVAMVAKFLDDNKPKTSLLISKFHVAVVQRRLRNVQKSMMHVQGCLLFFCRSRCRRRYRCLSSLLLWSKYFATMVTWRRTSLYITRF